MLTSSAPPDVSCPYSACPRTNAAPSVISSTLVIPAARSWYQEYDVTQRTLGEATCEDISSRVLMCTDDEGCYVRVLNPKP